MPVIPELPHPLPNTPGRPANSTSSQLATKAWVRHLLNRLGDVEAWATGKKPKPQSWEALKAGSAGNLRRTFGLAAKAPKVSVDVTKQRASELDKVLQNLAVLKDGANPFEKSYGNGAVAPRPEVLAAMENLVPGSLAFFSRPPPPMDPLFYTALDFVNPLTGGAFVRRQIAPDEFDPKNPRHDGDERGYEQMSWLFGAGSTVAWSFGERLPDDSDDDVTRVFERFSSDILLATACALNPIEARHVEHVRDELIGRLRTWEGTTEDERARDATWPPVIPTTSIDYDLTSLTNAIAAYRLTKMLPLGEDTRWYATLWLQVVLTHIGPDLDELDRKAFYHAPRDKEPAIKRTLWGIGFPCPRVDETIGAEHLTSDERRPQQP